jgi:apolipoprotein N-acyltransferase
MPLLMALLGRDRNKKLLRPLQGFLLAYLCGVLWYVGNCYWIYRTMHVYESIPMFASLGILVLFAMYVGLYHGLFGWLIVRLHQSFSRTLTLCAVPFFWVAVELARARITGFPWDLLGYTQVDNSVIARLAPLTGVMGISFLIAAVNALWLIRLPARGHHKVYFGTGIAALITLIATYEAVHVAPPSHEPAPVVATLVQENLGVGSAAEHESKQEMLQSFSALSLAPKVAVTPTMSQLHGTPIGVPATIIVWPEAPTPFIDSDPVFRESMEGLATKAHVPVIANAITFASRNPDGRENLYNSASFFHSNGTYGGHYDKMHLVPFGEYTPYKPLFFFVGHLLDDLVFVPGTHRTLLEDGGHRYGVFICYESIFGDDLRNFARTGAEVLVNISDDGWYGDTSAQWEHLDMVRMRAIENRRWIVRATNTGITASIDPYGRVIATLPRSIRSSIDVGFGYRDDMTFYTRHGDWFAWVCAITTMVWLVLAFGSRAIFRVKIHPGN